MSKIYPGYHQINLQRPNVDFPDPFEDVKIPRMILKAVPYVYCTEKDIHHPNADVKIAADLYVGTELSRPKKRGRYTAKWRAKIEIESLHRCEIDVENCRIIDKKGNLVEAENKEEVINAIYRNIFEGK